MQSVQVEMELWECTQAGGKNNIVKLGVPFYEG